MCDVTHSYEWHDYFVRLTWLVLVRDMTYSRVTRIIYMRDMTHPYVWCDSWLFVTWKTKMYDITPSYVGCYSCRSQAAEHCFHTWLSHVTHMNESCHTQNSVTSLESMSHVTPIHESCHTLNQLCRTSEKVIYVTWRIHIYDMTHSVSHDSSISVTWPIHTLDVTHSCVRHDLWMC